MWFFFIEDSAVHSWIISHDYQPMINLSPKSKKSNKIKSNKQAHQLKQLNLERKTWYIQSDGREKNKVCRIQTMSWNCTLQLKRTEVKIEGNCGLEDTYRMWRTNDGNLLMKYSVYGYHILTRYFVSLY